MHTPRKSEQKALDHERRDRIFGFLRENQVGVLSTVDPNNDPHATAIYYAVEPDLTITFMTKSGTKKSDNIAHNNHVMLLVYEPSSQTTVQIKGKAEKITDISRTNKAFSGILQAAWDTSEDGVPPITRLAAGEYVAYSIKLKEVRMAVYARPEIGNYDDLFETLEEHDLKA